MKKNKVLGVLLVLLAVATGVGMVIQNDDYWNIHNYVTIILCIICGALLIKQK